MEEGGRCRKSGRGIFKFNLLVKFLERRGTSHNNLTLYINGTNKVVGTSFHIRDLLALLYLSAKSGSPIRILAIKSYQNKN